MDYLNMLKFIDRQMKKELKDVEKEMKSLPRGRLYGYKRSKSETFQYSLHEGKGDKFKRRGISRNYDLISKLARKCCLEEKRVRLLDNIAKVKEMLSSYKETDSLSVANALPKFCTALPREYYLLKEGKYKSALIKGERVDGEAILSLSPEEFATLPKEKRMEGYRAWAATSYEKSDMKIAGKIFAESGLHVRSKAEQAIADKLDHEGIPFRYEQVIKVGGRTCVPDFTIKTADLSDIYIEFCGMMDDGDYIKNFLDKRRAYEKAGIVEWKNIIYIYASGNDLDMREIAVAIEGRVKPRL